MPRRDQSNGQCFELDDGCGCVVTEDGNRARSSTSRLCEHRMVPADVCDAQHPARRPSGGPEIDETVAASPLLVVGSKRLGQRLRRRGGRPACPFVDQPAA